MPVFKQWRPPTCVIGGCRRKAQLRSEVCWAHWMACDQKLRDASLDAWAAKDYRQARRLAQAAIDDLKARLRDGATDDLRF